MKFTYFILSVIACIYADSLVDARRGNHSGGEIRRGPCGAGGRPTCANGQSPSFNEESMTLSCLDLSTPLCPDDSVPDFTGGRGGGFSSRSSPCDDSSRPTCADGEKPIYDREQETVSCADSSTPLCSNGSIPDFTLRQEGEGRARGPRGRGRGRGRGGACPIDEEKPLCADGERPMYSPEEMIHVCMDGSVPLCSDGSTPMFDGGRNEEATTTPPIDTSTVGTIETVSSPPPLEVTPVGSGSVCPNGSLPSCLDSSRPFEDVNGLFVCTDGTTPVC